MDAGRSFTWMFEQDGWIGKVLIGGLMFLIPFVGWFFIAGYGVRTLAMLCQGEERLPEWNDWGDLLVKGLVITLAGILYGIPGAILQALGLDLLGLLASLAGSFVLAAAVIHYATTNYDFASLYDFNWIIKFVQENLGNYILAWLLVLVAGFIAVFGVILFIIGVLFTAFWASLVYAHLYGQVYRLSPTTR